LVSFLKQDPKENLTPKKRALTLWTTMDRKNFEFRKNPFIDLQRRFIISGPDSITEDERSYFLLAKLPEKKAALTGHP
jgi:hypothetical protein